MQKIYLAGGCFWGIEAYFQRVKGILATRVGYANGKSFETSYARLKDTDHAETVEVVYDENIINLAEIFERFYRIIDVSSFNKQGNDVGRQYRSGIYYIDDYAAAVAKVSLALLAKHTGAPIAIELEKLTHFIEAEDYHQNYLKNNPTGYCHINLSMASEKISRQQALKDAEIAALALDEESLDILLHKATERPFSSEYNAFSEVGLYVDKISRQALFSSEDKYDAGCGWPSFTKTISTDAVLYLADNSYGMQRIEVQSSIQAAHLGHVFNDGLKEKGSLRYCINGKSLLFIPLAKLVDSPYEHYLPYFRTYVLAQSNK